jgi:hypothetical protein
MSKVVEKDANELSKVESGKKIRCHEYLVVDDALMLIQTSFLVSYMYNPFLYPEEEIRIIFRSDLSGRRTNIYSEHAKTIPQLPAFPLILMMNTLPGCCTSCQKFFTLSGEKMEGEWPNKSRLYAQPMP